MIYDKLTPFEYLEFVAGLWRIEAKPAEARARELIGWLGLEPHAHERCEGFSRGMRQKVALAGALVHDPKLIILDEPLTGLDAGSARLVKNVLRERVAAGGTVIMTTHILEVAERMADRIGVIASGRLIAEGTLDELRHKTGKTAASLEDTFLTLVAEPVAGRVSRPDTLTWLAGHELRLGWRDWVALMTAGRRNRARTVAIALVVFAAFMHLFAYWIVAGYADASVASDTATLVGITGTLVLSWSLLLSQAMELVTRAFYARSDLDLILTSPVSARKVFAVRMGRIAAAVRHHRRAAGGALHQRAGDARRRALARRLRRGRRHGRGGDGGGARAHHRAVSPGRRQAHAADRADRGGGDRRRLRHRLADRGDLLLRQHLALRRAAIALDAGARARHASAFWWPAHAVLGDLHALVAVVAFSFALLGVAIALFSRRFGDHALAAAGVSSTVVRQRRWPLAFRRRSPARVLRQKEWTLLARDPWLISQTLMQILYLLPPALLLWVTFRNGAGSYVVLIPVVVMAAGQLAGGLAWLSISGEDAPDLVASAPIPRAASCGPRSKRSSA